MACLRETPLDGRVGTVSCNEEGCLLRLVTSESGGITSTNASEAHCVLQLRLRTGDAPNTLTAKGNVWDPIRGEYVELEFELTEAQHKLLSRGTYTNFRLVEDEDAVSTFSEHGPEPVDTFKPVYADNPIFRVPGPYPWAPGAERPVEGDSVGERLEPGTGAEEGMGERLTARYVGIGDGGRYWIFKGKPYRWNPDLRDGKGDLEEVSIDVLKQAEIHGVTIDPAVEPSRHGVVDWDRIKYFRVWIEDGDGLRYENIHKDRVIIILDTDGDEQDATDEEPEGYFTPREVFERVFGIISDNQWQFVKEWVRDGSPGSKPKGG